MSDRYLMHHGVKGMRWGVRHDRENQFKLSDKQKRIIKRVAIGAAITGGVLIASYGAVKVNDIRNYRMISKASKNAVQDVLRQRNREAIRIAKDEYSHPVYDHFSDKKESIIASYKEQVQKNRLKAVEDEKELVRNGYDTYKKLRNAKIKDMFSVSYFGKRSSLYDPYEAINNYRKFGY